MKKIFFLDALALIYRAHFAFANNHRYNSKGLNTSAIFGFMNSLVEVLDKEKPTHLGVAFDLPGGTFRNEMYTPYKAQREETPEEIISGIPHIKNLLKALQIAILEVQGFEADDVIGTLAHKAAEEGFEVYMVTPDKDYGQLLREGVYMYKPAKGGNGVEIIKEADICEKYGIEKANQFIDILGLWGDASDNIPGVPGIGEKTAQKLISQYKSVEQVIAHVDEIKGKVGENIKNNTEQAILSRELAKICLDVPIEFHVEHLELSPINEALVRPILEELEFKTLASKLFKHLPKAPLNSEPKTHPSEGLGQGSLFGDEEQEVPENPISSYKQYDPTTTHYQCITTEEGLLELLNQLLQQKAVAFDTETTGLDPLTNDIIGFSICFEANKAFYIPLIDDISRKEILTLFKPFFESDCLLIGQNLKFDLRVLAQNQIEPKNPLFDTMIAHYVLHSERKHNLDDLSKTYLNYEPISIESLIGKKGKNQGQMQMVDIETVTIYACEDADLTFQLYLLLKQKLQSDEMEQLFYQVEMPLVKILAEMENTGINLDIKALNEYDLLLEQETLQIEKEIFECAGKSFNINSPKQLGDILFNTLDLHKGKKKSNLSTAEEVLVKLKSEHPIVEKVLEYRSLQKLRSTYIKALPLLINPKDKRLHTQYNQALTSTGRLSSNNPNLQNIPIKTEKGREIRKSFIPKDEHHCLVSADYSQIELRIIASLSEDPNLCKAFQENTDIHTDTACKLYTVSRETVTPEMRRQAKTVNFGILYGISSFGLAERLGISKTEAGTLIKNYFMAYPNIKAYMDSCIEKAQDTGFAETLLGRKRLIPDIKSSNKTQREFAERTAINMPVQGTSADMIKLAMIGIAEQIKKQGLKTQLLLQVHDELIFDVPKDELERIKPIIVAEMQQALPLLVPIEVNISEGQNWLEAH